MNIRQIIAMALSLTLFAALTVGSAETALANANENASCMGHEGSDVSPPGSSTEAPGGMPDAIEFVRTDPFVSALLKNDKGIGPAIMIVASLHEGSHAACDEALEPPS